MYPESVEIGLNLDRSVQACPGSMNELQRPCRFAVPIGDGMTPRGDMVRTLGRTLWAWKTEDTGGNEDVLRVAARPKN